MYTHLVPRHIQTVKVGTANVAKEDAVTEACNGAAVDVYIGCVQRQADPSDYADTMACRGTRYRVAGQIEIDVVRRYVYAVSRTAQVAREDICPGIVITSPHCTDVAAVAVDGWPA